MNRSQLTFRAVLLDEPGVGAAAIQTATSEPPQRYCRCCCTRCAEWEIIAPHWPKHLAIPDPGHDCRADAPGDMSCGRGGERTHRASALCVRARVPAGAEARDAARRPVKPIRGNERKRKKKDKPCISAQRAQAQDLRRQPPVVDRSFNKSTIHHGRSIGMSPAVAEHLVSSSGESCRRR